MRLNRRVDLALYAQALVVYARNVGVLVFPLIAAAIALGLDYASRPLFAPVGGAFYPIVALIIAILYGFAFAVAVIFADDAWRHGRARIGAAWTAARRKGGNILLAVIGFLFLIYVAQLIGGLAGDYGAKVLGALAVWAFIYAIPAAAIGGVPGGASFSASLQGARRHPVATAILTIVSIAVYYGLGLIVPDLIGQYLGIGYDVARILLMAIALGYVALIAARQYSDLAFRPYW